jgi:hypothetical protein
VAGRTPAWLPTTVTDKVGCARKFSGTLSKMRTDRQTVVAQHFDALADLEDHAAVGRKHLRLLARFRTGGRIDANDGDLLSDGFFHELGGIADRNRSFVRRC